MCMYKSNIDISHYLNIKCHRKFKTDVSGLLLASECSGLKWQTIKMSWTGS